MRLISNRYCAVSELRGRITQALIERKGFNVVAAEADWPDAARIDHYVRHRDAPASEWEAFARFPTWMWRNEEMRRFVDWLRETICVDWCHACCH